MEANVFANKWILTLFGYIFPSDLVFRSDLQGSEINYPRVWDHFLVEGWSIALQLGLALIKMSEDDLLKMPMEDVFVYFDSLPPEKMIPGIFLIVYVVIPEEKLFKCAYEYVIDDDTKQQLQNLNDVELDAESLTESIIKQ